MTDKFLDVMIEQVEKWMQFKKEERIFLIQEEKPKYMSTTYLEKDTHHVHFLDGVPNGVDGTIKEACLSMRVMFGRATQGYGSHILDIPEIARSASRLRWALESRMPEAIDEAFKDYAINTTNTYWFQKLWQSICQKKRITRVNSSVI